jgi:hypothetical protein
MATYKCLICGKEKYIRPSHLRNGNGKYCSMKCWGIAQLGIKSHNYKENGNKTRVGSRRIPRYILIAEKVLKRPLKTLPLGNPNGEVVHHINLDHQDNRNKNLLICTQSYHIALHNKMRARKEILWRI